MIKRLIGSVRRKPRAIREGVAFWAAITLSGFIAVVWLYHMPARFVEVDFALDDSGESEQNLFDGFQSQLSTVREGLPNADQIDLSALEESPSEEIMRERADAFISEQMASSTAQNQVVTPSNTTQNPPQPTRTPIRIITTSSTASSSQISR